MGLVISLARNEAERATALEGQLSCLCERIIMSDDAHMYIPLSGKLIPVLRIFTENKITYELKIDPPHQVESN